MSVQAATDFLKKTETDETLRNKIFPLYNHETGNWDGPALVKIGKDQGFDFTPQEVGQASEKSYGQELSDQQLEYVSGGKCCCTSSSSCC
jgi:predicted ribosomally synthesized peptide with nif11-like leader